MVSPQLVLNRKARRRRKKCIGGYLQNLRKPLARVWLKFVWRIKSRTVYEVLGELIFRAPLIPHTWCNMMSKKITLLTAGGRIRCTQCQAMAKSTQQQCGRPATSGKLACKLHGGHSTGPKTPEGRQRCAAARTTDGQETTSMRRERSLASARLAALEMAGHALGMMSGTRTRGRKPALMCEVEPELNQIFLRVVLRQAAKK
jgi:hypothetical protein